MKMEKVVSLLQKKKIYVTHTHTYIYEEEEY